MLILEALKILFADLLVFFLSFDLHFPIRKAKKFLVCFYFRLLAKLLEMDKTESSLCFNVCHQLYHTVL